MNTALHFSSERHDWETPRAFFDQLNLEFGFTLDAAASPHNALVGTYFTAEDNGLAQDWGLHTVWCNPPYGRGIYAWMRKARDAAQQGATVVMLVPAKTDTAAWHDVVIPHAEIRFVRGRLKFGGSKVNAPFPSAVLVFRPGSVF